VGATHSPQLLRQLAGPATRAGLGQQVPGLAPPAAAKGAERGVDVAFYQHPNGAAINWPRVHASGIGFAAVKVTEGAYYRNPYALADLAQARAAGLSVVAYAFAIPNGNGARRSPVTQADYLLRYLGTMSRSVPVMLDIEYNPYGRECYGLTARAMVSWISSFNSEVKAKTGRKPILYVPASWWAACTGSSTGFGQRQLWVPDYTTAPSPLLPAGWKTWSFWQYTSIGTVRGIQAPGHTDLDRANPAIPPVLGNQ
jgi:lysozyme